MEIQGTQKNHNNLGKEEPSWRSHIFWFQILRQGNSKQYSVVPAHKYRHIDQWNRIEYPGKKPFIYSKLRFDKDAETTK